MESQAGPRSVSIETLQQLRRQDSEFRATEGSAFEVAVVAFSELVERLQGRLLEVMAASFRAGCRKYQKEK